VSAVSASSATSGFGLDPGSGLCSMRFTGRPRPIPATVSCVAGQGLPQRCPVAWMGCGAAQWRCTGIDTTTLAEIEQYGVTRLLDELAAELTEGTYRPFPTRRVWIAKPGTSEQRPLSIPAVRDGDRIVQAAVKIVLDEPIFEADFLPCSFGFRPRRSPTMPCRCSQARWCARPTSAGASAQQPLAVGQGALLISGGPGEVCGGLQLKISNVEK
jgi:hypothetical protein